MARKVAWISYQSLHGAQTFSLISQSWSRVGEYASTIRCFWEIIVQFLKKIHFLKLRGAIEIEDFIHPENIRKSTINSPLNCVCSNIKTLSMNKQSQNEISIKNASNMRFSKIGIFRSYTVPLFHSIGENKMKKIISRYYFFIAIHCHCWPNSSFVCFYIAILLLVYLTCLLFTICCWIFLWFCLLLLLWSIGKWQKINSRVRFLSIPFSSACFVVWNFVTFFLSTYQKWNCFINWMSLLTGATAFLMYFFYPGWLQVLFLKRWFIVDCDDCSGKGKKWDWMCRFATCLILHISNHGWSDWLLSLYGWRSYICSLV